MNPNLNLEFSTLRDIYARHKNYVMPIIIIVVCFVLLTQITLPQLTSLSQKQQDENFEKTKLNTINRNLQIVNSFDAKTLDSELSLSTDALPIGKDFVGIINSINLAANKTGVILGDYEFLVGDLSKTPPGKSAPSLEISLSVSGGVPATASFMTELYKSLPIAEVTNLIISNNRSSLTAVFYYKPFGNVSDATIPIGILSSNQISILKELSTWNDSKNLGLIPVSTSSATPSAAF